MAIPVSQSSMEARACRAAKRIGLTTHKSRWRQDTIDNHGGFMVLDGNHIINGSRYDLTAEEVIGFCEELQQEGWEAGLPLPRTARLK